MNKTVAELIAQAGLPADADITKVLPSLTFHVTHPLKRDRISTIGDLAARTDDDLLEIWQFGQRRLDMLKAALAGLPSPSPRTIAIDDGCEVRVFDPDPDQGDVSPMYVMEALGVSMLVYVRKDGSGTYVHVEDEGIPEGRGPLLVEVNNSGENTYGDAGSGGRTSELQDMLTDAAVIADPSYAETAKKLAADPIVQAMAEGLRAVPIDQLAHDDSIPRHEFMNAANREYSKRGGQPGGHLGSLATALLQILKQEYQG
ncbi:DNA-directed RNA polymerase subunit alpha C-terminal domain-containing protein [Nonomuraea maritima]|uniref:DNA-directed RNA polymerase subunit alpha C-terminal domain-containing protein n=1 Tax=Nonomuraea maritima TaxID=683260 RepID=UPI00371DE3CF